MKTIYYILLVFCAQLLVTKSIMAQEYKIVVSNSRSEKLLLENLPGNLVIEGYNGTEIRFSRTTLIGKNSLLATRQVKGANSFSDNTCIGLRIEKKGNMISVYCVSTQMQMAEYKITLPNNISLQIENDGGLSKDITVSDLNNQIEISNNQSIKLVRIEGSMILSSKNGNIILEKCVVNKDATLSVAAISGNIKAELSRVNTMDPIVFNSISGNVVLVLPNTFKGGYKLKTTSGQIKSDFNFLEESKTTNQLLGTQINFQKNGQTTLINVTTLSGNIIIQKGS